MVLLATLMSTFNGISTASRSSTYRAAMEIMKSNSLVIELSDSLHGCILRLCTRQELGDFDLIGGRGVLFVSCCVFW